MARSVGDWAKREGIGRGNHVRERTPERTEKIARIGAMYRAGATQAEIGRVLGLSGGRVAAFMRHYGIPTRPRGVPKGRGSHGPST